ncbi:MAG TPA: hypothetical protein VM935_15580 [Chitinophagaceae bacterium]|jgi:hypothetical protein|nr:hypothetical protein [Chitinophagaceae bacterium]
MKRKIYLPALLLILSLISGVLLSKASLVGRTGINLFYKEYKFLKLWWQGSFVVFITLMVVFGIHSLLAKKLNRSAANKAHLLSVVIALTGLFFTYQDFRNTLTHRLLGERFHLGAYLFWLGWIIVAVYFLVVNRKINEVNEPSGTKG